MTVSASAASDLGTQFGREEAAFLQRGEDGFAPFVQFLQGGEAITDGGDRHFVEAPVASLR